MTALDGFRVLDMTQYEAGTSCTQALAWLGADVVKVESPRGDPGRGPTGNAEYFIVWNSNKRSVSIDLQQPRGRQMLLDMLPRYDAFVENYGPGVMEKLDLGYDVMKAVNPGIIYARVKGFGLEGPWSDYKCYDMVAQSAAGAFSITGEPDGPPVRPGPTTGDAGTGVQMALAITAAYAQKLRTGKGQHIELSMQEAMTYYLRTATASTHFGARPSLRVGNGGRPTMSLYRSGGDGPNDYLFVMAVTHRMWENLCRAMERPDLLEDPRYTDHAARQENRTALSPRLPPGWWNGTSTRGCARSAMPAFRRARCSTRRTSMRTRISSAAASCARSTIPCTGASSCSDGRPGCRKAPCPSSPRPCSVSIRARSSPPTSASRRTRSTNWSAMGC